MRARLTVSTLLIAALAACAPETTVRPRIVVADLDAVAGPALPDGEEDPAELPIGRDDAPVDVAGDPTSDLAADLPGDVPLDGPPDVPVDLPADLPSDIPVDLPPDVPVDPGCVPACGGRACGDDGCGGSCGTCDPGTCKEGRCVIACGGPACRPGLACEADDGTAGLCGGVIDCDTGPGGEPLGHPVAIGTMFQDVGVMFYTSSAGFAVYTNDWELDSVSGGQSCATLDGWGNPWTGEIYVRFVVPGTSGYGQGATKSVSFYIGATWPGGLAAEFYGPEAEPGAAGSTLLAQLVTTRNGTDFLEYEGKPAGWVRITFGTDRDFTIDDLSYGPIYPAGP